MLGFANDELAALAGAGVLAARVLVGVAGVLWCWAADRGPLIGMNLYSTLLMGLAAACAAVGLLSVAGGPPPGIRLFAYGTTAFGGFILGVVFDFALSIRLYRVSLWLASLRVPRYREMLSSPGSDSRLRAAERLSRIGRYARPAFPELYAALRDDSPEVRAAASLAILMALGDSPPADDTETATAVRPLLADPNPAVRLNAAAVLTRLNAADAAEVLPILCEALTGGEPADAATAAQAVCELGPAGAPAIPALRAAIFDHQPPVALAAQALAAIGAPALPVLIEALERGDAAVKWEAAEALGGMGETGRDALPALRKAAAHPDDFVKNAARAAIKKLGGDVG